MEENNCIVICFPQGSGGHIAGRILASCNNVAWYNHEKNGKYPWDEYRIGDDLNFSKLHFNKRFEGALGRGVCNLTVPPVLDMAEKQDLQYDKQSIINWKDKIRPNNLVYTLHADLDKAKDFFKPAKFFVIIPEDIDVLLDRWFATTAYYYVDPKNKKFLYIDLYQQRAEQAKTSVKEVLRSDMILQIENYKKHADSNDVVVSEVKDMFDRSTFKNICKKFNLQFNQSNYEKTIELANQFSHL